MYFDQTFSNFLNESSPILSYIILPAVGVTYSILIASDDPINLLTKTNVLLIY